MNPNQATWTIPDKPRPGHELSTPEDIETIRALAPPHLTENLDLLPPSIGLKSLAQYLRDKNDPNASPEGSLSPDSSTLSRAVSDLDESEEELGTEDEAVAKADASPEGKGKQEEVVSEEEPLIEFSSSSEEKVKEKEKEVAERLSKNAKRRRRMTAARANQARALIDTKALINRIEALDANPHMTLEMRKELLGSLKKVVESVRRITGRKDAGRSVAPETTTDLWVEDMDKTLAGTGKSDADKPDEHETWDAQKRIHEWRNDVKEINPFVGNDTDDEFLKNSTRAPFETYAQQFRKLMEDTKGHNARRAERFVRPPAERFVRPPAERFVRPPAERFVRPPEAQNKEHNAKRTTDSPEGFRVRALYNVRFHERHPREPVPGSPGVYVPGPTERMIESIKANDRAREFRDRDTERPRRPCDDPDARERRAKMQREEGAKGKAQKEEDARGFQRVMDALRAGPPAHRPPERKPEAAEGTPRQTAQTDKALHEWFERALAREKAEHPFGPWDNEDTREERGKAKREETKRASQQLLDMMRAAEPKPGVLEETPEGTAKRMKFLEEKFKGMRAGGDAERPPGPRNDQDTREEREKARKERTKMITQELKDATRAEADAEGRPWPKSEDEDEPYGKPPTERARQAVDNPFDGLNAEMLRQPPTRLAEQHHRDRAWDANRIRDRDWPPPYPAQLPPIAQDGGEPFVNHFPEVARLREEPRVPIRPVWDVMLPPEPWAPGERREGTVGAFMRFQDLLEPAMPGKDRREPDQNPWVCEDQRQWDLRNRARWPKERRGPLLGENGARPPPHRELGEGGKDEKDADLRGIDPKHDNN